MSWSRPLLLRLVRFDCFLAFVEVAERARNVVTLARSNATIGTGAVNFPMYHATTSKISSPADTLELTCDECQNYL